MNLNPNLALEVNNIEYEDKKRLLHAIQLSKQCIPVKNAFSVGAVVFDAAGNLVSTGYSREEGDRSHAEEVALNRAQRKGVHIEGGIIYSSMEPCGKRSSSDKTCTERIIESGIIKVVFALHEPHIFVYPVNIDRFSNAGIQLVHIPEFEPDVTEINKHLITP